MFSDLKNIFLANPSINKFDGGKYGSIAPLLSQLLDVAILIAAALAFFWFVWGAFQYITAGGKKEELAKARARITWAIIGLAIVMLAYLMTQFAAQIIPPSTGTPL